MRNPFSTIPMLRIWLAMAMGVGLQMVLARWGVVFPAFSIAAVALCVLGVLCLITIRQLSIEKQFKLQLTEGVLVSVSLVALGYALAWNYSDKNDTRFFAPYLQKETATVVRITEPPVQKAKIVNAVAEVLEIGHDTAYANLQGKIALSFLKDSTSLNLHYGDVLAVQAKIEPFDEPKNPEEFNYKQYQANKNIFYRAFLVQGDWKVIQSDAGNPFFAGIYHLRERLLQVINVYVKDENDFGVATAIMLGYRDYVNADILQAYGSSGALHVLSVSGLHVGVLFMMLNFLLGWLDKKGRNYVIGKAIFIIGFIWAYACLTGLCPSVLRSALMFSMMQVGMVFRRDVSIYNVVASTALLLMLFNPYIITDVGFQLSYLAVLGIVFLQPKIYALLAFKTKAADWMWKLTAVSIAAQVATFPVSIYYFHQFPNLFLFSNLLVIPLSDGILIAGMVMFLVQWIPGLNALSGFCFKWLLWAMNHFIFWIDSLPFAQSTGLSFTGYEMILLYAVLLLLCWLWVEQRPRVAVLTTALAFLLCCSFSLDRVKDVRQREIIVYCVKGKKAIGFLNGKTLVRDFDDGLLADERTLQYYVRPHLWKHGIMETVPLDGALSLPFGKLVEFEGKRVLIVDKEVIGNTPKQKLKVDVCIISQSPKLYITKLKAVIDCDMLVFDSSNSHKQVKYWQKDCEELQQPYYDVSAQGAYIMEL
ncbi:MAG: ComEC/Rec2 family competence protein [Chitinophagales bacterium]